MFETMHEGRELPQFTLRQIDLPDILNWQVNGSYYVLCRVEMTGLRNRSDLPASEDMSKIEADFKIQSVRAIDDKPIDIKEIEKKEFEKIVSKVKSGEI